VPSQRHLGHNKRTCPHDLHTHVRRQRETGAPWPPWIFFHTWYKYSREAKKRYLSVFFAIFHFFFRCPPGNFSVFSSVTPLENALVHTASLMLNNHARMLWISLLKSSDKFYLDKGMRIVSPDYEKNAVSLRPFLSSLQPTSRKPKIKTISRMTTKIAAEQNSKYKKYRALFEAQKLRKCW